MPSVGSSFVIVTDAVSTRKFRGDCLFAIHQISSTWIGMSEREGQDPPEGGDEPSLPTVIDMRRSFWIIFGYGCHLLAEAKCLGVALLISIVVGLLLN